MDELGLSGAAVARRAGIGPKQFNNYVNDQREPDLATAARIASALRIPLGDLVDPDTQFSPRDDRASLAMQRLEMGWQHLEGHDAVLVADFVEFLAMRRRDETTDLFTFAGDNEIRRELIRVHQELVPAILNRFTPLELQTEIAMHDDDALWSYITLKFDERLDRTELAGELVLMAQNRLSLKQDKHARLIRKDPDQVIIGIRLGRAPRPTRPVDTPQGVRHRSRPARRAFGLRPR